MVGILGRMMKRGLGGGGSSGSQQQAQSREKVGTATVDPGGTSKRGGVSSNSQAPSTWV
jgi:hypothetical protein